MADTLQHIKDLTIKINDLDTKKTLISEYPIEEYVKNTEELIKQKNILLNELYSAIDKINTKDYKNIQEYQQVLDSRNKYKSKLSYVKQSLNEQQERQEDMQENMQDQYDKVVCKYNHLLIKHNDIQTKYKILVHYCREMNQ